MAAAAGTHFSREAVSAFERTYRCLFTQAHQEVERLERINRAMQVLEDNLLDPNRIADMEPVHQIALAELLSKAQQTTIKNLMGFGHLFMNIRTVVGLLDGVQNHTAFPGAPIGQFPSRDVSADYERDE